MGPIVLFSYYKLSTFGLNQIEDFDHAHNRCLGCKFISSCRNRNFMSFGLDHDKDRLQQGLTNLKATMVFKQVRNLLKDVYGFAENQESVTCGLECSMTRERREDDAVLNTGSWTAYFESVIRAKLWYVPPFTPKVELHIEQSD